MAAPISALVHASFDALVAADWEPDARSVFRAESAPAALSAALEEPAFAAVDGGAGELRGFILLRRPSLLSMLFVHPGHLREGVGRRLWEAARSHVEATYPETTTIELNATPYALAAYRALGFVPISAEFVRGGCRVTRMACWLPARSLGAEPR